MLVCDSCASVNDFATTAENYVLAHTNLYIQGFTFYWFVVYNPSNQRLAQIRVAHHYDRETGLIGTHAVALTGTIADMEQAYRVAFPDLGMTFIPASVATTYTGSNQQGVVGAYLANYYGNSNPVQDDTTLAVFPDYSSAVYQLTDAANSDWTMVTTSGHDTGGNPLDDNAQPVTTTPPPGTIIAPLTQFMRMHDSGGGYGVTIFGIKAWVNGILTCMEDGCTHIKQT